MMALLFTLFLAAFGLAATGRYRPAVICFAATLVLSALWFKHHATDTLAILL